MSDSAASAAARPRILFAYHHFPAAFDQSAAIRRLCQRLRRGGMRIDCEPITLSPPGPPLFWPELDARWRRGDPELLRSYERLVRRLDGCDALVNASGINLHPEFVRQLGVATLYACCDDPESSELLSRPVAHAYDACLVGNIAEVESYRAWGVRDARWLPLGFSADDHDPALTAERILSGERDVEVSLLCERVSGWRAARLDRFAAAFPGGVFRGRGWTAGWLPEAERVPLYQRTRIGPNFHNSTGPVNMRTYILPANGVMQICDNRSHLGRIFTLGSEAVGVDSVDEAIEACRYYLAHDDERRRIAAAGWARAMRDYGESAVFARLEAAVREVLARKRPPESPDHVRIPPLLRARRCRRPAAVAAAAALRACRAVLGPARRLAGRMLRRLGLRR